MKRDPLIDKICELAVENALLKAKSYRPARRERRRDAADIIAARINTTERLRKSVGRA